MSFSVQEQFDEAMHAFSRGEYDRAIAELRAALDQDPTHFDAQLALGMAWYRKGDYAQAIAEGHKAEQMRPKEQLVHTNLSLFYMKAGNKVVAEQHGLQARIASWRDVPADGHTAASDPELAMAGVKPQNQVFKSPPKFPERPWKKQPPAGQTAPPKPD
jgi:tetratricopeptide (TPR) repeat protein